MALFKKSPLTSSRLAKRKRKIFAVKIILGLLLVAFLAFGAAWFSRKPEFQITSVEISGNTIVGASDIQEIIRKNISGFYAFLFPRSNSFMYPHEEIKKDLFVAFPEIASVNLSVKNQAMIVSVKEHVPAYLWCRGNPDERSKDCYFMNKDGYVFSAAPNFSLAGQAGNVYFAYYGMISADNPIGSTYLDFQQFEKLNRIQAELDKNNIKTFAENSEADGLRELYLNRGGRIIFKNTQDPVALVSALGLVKSQTDVLNRTDATLEYLDMRFGNKVYYRFVGDNAVQSSQ